LSLAAPPAHSEHIDKVRLKDRASARMRGPWPAPPADLVAGDIAGSAFKPAGGE